jgi:hypothetical protein
MISQARNQHEAGKRLGLFSKLKMEIAYIRKEGSLSRSIQGYSPEAETFSKGIC